MVHSIQLVLKFHGIVISVTNAEMEVDKRADVLSNFAENPNQTLLIATNGYARGINFPEVCMVFHLDMPGQITTYYYRTTRGGECGNYFNMFFKNS